MVFDGVILVCYINPHNTDIFYRLIIPCGVRLTPDQDSPFALTEMKQTVFTCTLHIIWKRIRQVPLHNPTPEPQPQHPWATCLSYKQKIKCPSEPKEQDIQYPITSLIFVIESQSLCLYPCFQGQGSQFSHLLSNWRNFFLKVYHCN